jgi:hypothetical protein
MPGRSSPAPRTSGPGTHTGAAREAEEERETEYAGDGN